MDLIDYDSGAQSPVNLRTPSPPHWGGEGQGEAEELRYIQYINGLYPNVITGLVPVTHVGPIVSLLEAYDATSRRGWPGQARPWRKV